MALNKSTDGPGQFRAADGSQFEVTADGSLSLLALGYRGLMAWRAKRIEVADLKGKAPKKQ
ncbi:MAG: hypothetical protein IPL86_08010 [Flavobacteriales bacterium]|nr:hypothetical protein [Flavobacteriales bacterium]